MRFSNMARIRGENIIQKQYVAYSQIKIVYNILLANICSPTSCYVRNIFRLFLVMHRKFHIYFTYILITYLKCPKDV